MLLVINCEILNVGKRGEAPGDRHNLSLMVTSLQLSKEAPAISFLRRQPHKHQDIITIVLEKATMQ